MSLKQRNLHYTNVDECIVLSSCHGLHMPTTQTDADLASVLVHAFMTSHVDYRSGIPRRASEDSNGQATMSVKLLHESSVTTKSFIRDCHDLCTRSYTGWTFPSE